MTRGAKVESFSLIMRPTKKTIGPIVAALTTDWMSAGYRTKTRSYREVSEKERIRELIRTSTARIKAPPTKSAKNDALSPTRIHTHMVEYLQVEASIDQRVANLGTRTLVGQGGQCK
jgi:hypothetical protein